MATTAFLRSLRRFSTCEISDALIKLKQPNGGLLPDVNIISPAPSNPAADDLRVVGPAYTVKMVDKADTNAPKPNQHYVDAAVPGGIIVISAPRHLKSAVWGGLMSARAKAIGALGVVIDGRVRDIGEHRAAGFPVFCRDHSTLPQGSFARPSELQVDLTLPADTSTSSSGPATPFPDTVVHSGDIVVADIDGVVIVGKDMVDAVISACEKIRAADDKCMEDLQNGRSVTDAFAEHRGS